MTVRLRTLRGVITGLLSVLVLIVVQLVLTPLLIHRLGAESFGVWIVGLGVVSYLLVLDFGLFAFVTREVARLGAPGDREEMSGVIRRSFGLSLALGVAVFLVAWGLGSLLPVVLPHLVSSRGAGELGVAIVILGAQVAVALPLAVGRAVMTGVQAISSVSIIETGGYLLRAAAIVLVLLAGGGVADVAVAHGIQLVGVEAVLFILAWRRVGGASFRPSLPDRAFGRRLLSFSGVMFLTRALAYSGQDGDRILIGVFASPGIVSTYEIGNRVNALLRLVFSVFLRPFLPAFSEALAAADRDRVRRLYLFGSKYSVVLASAIALPFLLQGRDFIRLWIGEQFAGAYLPMALLLAANLFQSQAIVGHSCQWGTGRTRPFIPATIAAFVINLGLGIAAMVLMEPEDGIIGVAAATLISYLVVETAFGLFVMRSIGVTALTFVRHVHLPLLLPVAAGLLASWGADQLLPPVSLIHVLARMGAFIVVFGVLVLLVGMGGEEKRWLVREVFERSRRHG